MVLKQQCKGCVVLTSHHVTNSYCTPYTVNTTLPLVYTFLNSEVTCLMHGCESAVSIGMRIGSN